MKVETLSDTETLSHCFFYSPARYVKSLTKMLRLQVFVIEPTQKQYMFFHSKINI